MIYLMDDLREEHPDQERTLKKNTAKKLQIHNIHSNGMENTNSKN